MLQLAAALQFAREGQWDHRLLGDNLVNTEREAKALSLSSAEQGVTQQHLEQYDIKPVSGVLVAKLCYTSTT